MNIFVKYRRINDEWKDVDIKQSKVALPANSTIDTLLKNLSEKWGLDYNELIVRCYDKDFGEFVDVEDDPDTVPIQNLTKYEVVHRVGKWARNSRENSERAVSTTGSTGDISDNPPSVKSENIEINNEAELDLEIARQNNNISSSNTTNPFQLRVNIPPNDLASSSSSSSLHAITPSTIDDISTKALSMFKSRGPKRAGPPPCYSMSVMVQLEKSEYGRQCIDHFKELASGTATELSHPIKVKFVNIIGQWLMMKCANPGQPTAEERRSFVSHCVAQLPCELSEQSLTNRDGTGTLDNYVKNRRATSKRRDGYLSAVKKPRLEQPASVEPAKSSFSDVDADSESESDHDIVETEAEKTIKEMATMDSSLFVGDIVEKHKETLKYRRRWINGILKRDPEARENIAHLILTRFPQMARINELITIDFLHMIKRKHPQWEVKSLARDWEHCWSKKILYYAVNNGNPFAVNALRDYGLEKIPSISDEDRCVFTLRLLPSLLQGKGTKVTGCDADSLIVEIKQENRSIVSAIESVRKGMQITCPLILQVTSYKPEFQSSYFVLIDETAIPVDGSFPKALELLIQAYCVFAIPYPQRLQGVYRLIEYFYKFQSVKRTSCFTQFIDILEKCPM